MSTQERKIKEKENRKQQILNAAEAIMEENGLNGLSIDLIAQYTQLAKGTIYLYFRSKEEILSILTIKARELLLNEFKKIAIKEITPIEKLKLIIIENYQFFKRHSLYYDLISLYEANHNVVETEEMYKSSNEISKIVAYIVLQGQKENLIDNTYNPYELTMNLWAMTVGVLQLFKVRGALISEKFGITEQNLLDNYMSIFLKGIKQS
jgi:AcrR family transcriptional regulator